MQLSFLKYKYCNGDLNDESLRLSLPEINYDYENVLRFLSLAPVTFKITNGWNENLHIELIKNYT